MSQIAKLNSIKKIKSFLINKKIEIVNAKPKDLANIMDYINIH